MFSANTKIIFALGLSLWVSGCTDSDQEIVKRESDGTDTFKFKQPPGPARILPKPAISAPSTQPKPDKKSDSDGTDTFVFKQDTRYFPKPKRETGK